jgi:hypothetical protein
MGHARASFLFLAFAWSGGWLACSSFSGDDKTPAVEAGVDGTVVAESGAPVDAGVDAPAFDSGCVPGPRTLCDDFEAPTISSQWAKAITAPGDLQLSTDQYVSPTHALAVVIDGDAGAGGNGQAQLRHEFRIPNVQGLTCDFELYTDTLTTYPGGNSSLIAFDLFHDIDSEADSLTGYMIVNQGATAVYTYAGIDGGTVAAQTGNPGEVPLQLWTHFRFDIDVVTKDVTVTRNGAPFLVVTAATAFTKNNGIGITFGVNAYAEATKYFIDDIACVAR